MADRVVGGRGYEPAYSGYRLQDGTLQTMLNMVKNRNLAGLEAALRREELDQEDLHTVLFKACYKNAGPIVEMLVRHPAYTPRILAQIVVDALDGMQAEFAFYLLDLPSFRDRALNAALHEAAGRTDEDERRSMVKELVRLGADTSSRDEKGRTALEIAKSAGSTDPVLLDLLHVQTQSSAHTSAVAAPHSPEAQTKDETGKLAAPTEQAQSAANPQSSQAERLFSQAVKLCRSANAMNLERQFEALANECQCLSAEERLRIVLEVIVALARNEDELVQGKAILSLQVMMASLPGEAMAAGLRAFCDSFDKFSRNLPWPGIVKWCMARARKLDPVTNAVACGKIASALDHFRQDVRYEIVEDLLDQARGFTEPDRVELMRVFAQNIEHLFKKSASSDMKDRHERKVVALIERTFCRLVKECASLKPENAAMILVILCNRLGEFEPGKRVEMYLLLAKQLPDLPPRQQVHLINGRGWGLIGNLTFLPDAQRLIAYKAIADAVVLLPETERKSMVVDLLDRQQVWRNVPAGSERESINKRLRDSVSAGS